MRIAITGGCGSVGKAFIELLYKDNDLTVIDWSEWSVAECQHQWPEVRFILDDFVNLRGEFDCLIVLAAFKHLSLGETNTASFIENNLTKLVKLYENVKTDRILYLGTDKAVEPICAYGMTKSLAEKLTWDAGGQVARSGNFIGSSGSVIPIWEKQIAEGKPVTITDERMVRYVIDLDDGAKQIWEGFLNDDSLIIPEMKKVRIMDFLAEVLKKHHYMTPEAYEPGVKVIGMQPGEKLDEKLRWDYEL